MSHETGFIARLHARITLVDVLENNKSRLRFKLADFFVLFFMFE